MVTSMINIYMSDQSSSSSYSLAVSLGHPTLTKEGKEDGDEAERRIRDTYKKIFPGWDENKSNLAAEAGKVCSVCAAADAMAPYVAMKSCAACARCFSRVY